MKFITEMVEQVTWEGMTLSALAVAKGPTVGLGLNQRRKYAK